MRWIRKCGGVNTKPLECGYPHPLRLKTLVPEYAGLNWTILNIETQ